MMREAGGGDGAIEEFCSICKLSRLERFPRAEDWTSQRICCSSEEEYDLRSDSNGLTLATRLSVLSPVLLLIMDATLPPSLPPSYSFNQSKPHPNLTRY
jgi:hypothetical protein